MSETTQEIKTIPDLSPRQIVEALDKYIIGQAGAKRACAIALRNRRRRQLVTGDLKDEILPKNILMRGATGVGKTEIARRIAKLANSPFIKVEATKFTEVGYVGRDVESMIRDLVEIAINLVKEEQRTHVETRAREMAIEKILDIYLPPLKTGSNLSEEEAEEQKARHLRHRELLREEISTGQLDTTKIELEVSESNSPSISVLGSGGMEELGFQIRDMMPNFFGRKSTTKKVPIKEALVRIQEEESEKMIDMDAVVKIALDRAANSGIIFLDEIDKIAGGSRGGGGPDVSRGGVQRDLLPIIEGCTVNTKYGMIATDHILFIAAGAFHVAKPSDLLPELQGRLPILVELDALTESDFYRILVEPQNSLIKQSIALLETEDVDLSFSDEAIREMARLAFAINETTDNIGARRLHAVVETVLEDLFFDASDLEDKTVVVDTAYVQKRVNLDGANDLTKYIL